MLHKSLHPIIHHALDKGDPYAFHALADHIEDHLPNTAEILRGMKHGEFRPRDTYHEDWADPEAPHDRDFTHTPMDHLDRIRRSPQLIPGVHLVLGRELTRPQQNVDKRVQQRHGQQYTAGYHLYDLRGKGPPESDYEDPATGLAYDNAEYHTQLEEYLDDHKPKFFSEAPATRVDLNRRTDGSKYADITGLTHGGDCEHCGKKDVALVHVTDRSSGKTIKLGSTCAGRLCHTTAGEKLHRKALVTKAHQAEDSKQRSWGPVTHSIMYDGESLHLARHVTELAHAFNPDKSPTAFADALAEVGHPLALFVRRAKSGLPLIRTSAGHEFTGLPGARGRKELHVPRVRSLESPDLGIHRVGFHYDPEAGAGHIVVTMKTTDPVSARETTWHAPATKVELKGLGLKSRRMKLARQPLSETTKALWSTGMTDETHRAVLADHLEELGDPLHHVLRAPDEKNTYNHLLREHGTSDRRLAIIRTPKHSGDIGINMSLWPSVYKGHVYVWLHNGRGNAHVAKVDTDTAKDIIDYHYAGKGKWPRVNDYTRAGEVKRVPVKLARPDVIADGMSNQQSTRRKLAAKIAIQAGLKLQALINARTQSQAGVLQTYGHENEPDAVDYAAAWYGLLSRSPRLTSFHVHDGGPDTYHTWKTGLDPDRVLEAAQGLGLNAVVTSGGSVSVLDAGNQAASPISALKEATYARAPLSEPGTAKAFASRDDYRNSIRAYERSVLGNRPSSPPTAGGE